MSGSTSIFLPNVHRVMEERSNVKTFIADMASREGPAYNRIKINWAKLKYGSGAYFYQNIYLWEELKE